MQGLMMDVPLLVSAMIDHAAECHGEREVVSREIDGSIRRYTYRDAQRRTKQLAQALTRLGLGAGERLGALCWNTRACFEMFYGAPGMGAVLHTINPRLFPEQLVYIINHAEDAWLAFDAATAELVRTLAPQLATVRGYIFLGTAEELPEGLDLPRVEFYEALLAAEDGVYDWPEFEESRASTICYTSGTTGDPKGVVYSHRSATLTAMMQMIGDTISGYRNGVPEVVMPMAPLFHGNGWQTPYSAPMMGFKLVLPGRDYEPEKLYELMEGEAVTLCYGVPTIWMILLNHMRATGKRFSHLRATVMSGSKPPRALQRALLTEYGVEPMQGWGMTEALSSTKFSLPHSSGPRGSADLSDEEKLDLYQYGGRRAFGSRFRIIDDAGKDLPADGTARGHLLVRGPTVAGGYLKREAGLDGATGVVDGWLHTGDVAILHPNGNVELADRSKDVIKSGGEWISSVELENAAMGHPEIAEAAVIAVEHPKWQERPLLIVTRMPGSTIGAEAVLDFLREKVATWWLPDAVEFVDTLPHTGTGKIWKLKLRDQFADYRLPGTE